MQIEFLFSACSMLVGAGETPMNKTHKIPAVTKLIFWHWGISKEEKNQVLGKNNKAGERDGVSIR